MFCFYFVVKVFENVHGVSFSLQLLEAQETSVPGIKN